MYIENTLECDDTLDTNNAVFDDFENGIDYDKWEIANYSWGEVANGGVIPENVFWDEVNDCVTMRALGSYYAKNEVTGVGDITDGSLTGGVLVLRQPVKPGRYEARIRVAPREGCTNAFWIYSEDESGRPNEIDIETPVVVSGDVFSFRNCLFSTYYEGAHTSERGVTEINLADNEYHVIGFDWYSPSTLTGRYVRFFIDGQFVKTLRGDAVPRLSARLFIGVWVSGDTELSGKSRFEKAFMDIDYVKYTPFLGPDCIERDFGIKKVAEKEKYPVRSTPKWRRNFFQNGSLNYTDGLTVSDDAEIFDGYINFKVVGASYMTALTAYIQNCYEGNEFSVEIDYAHSDNTVMVVMAYDVNDKSIPLLKEDGTELEQVRYYFENDKTKFSTKFTCLADTSYLYIQFLVYGKGNSLTLNNVFIGYINGKEYELRLDDKTVNLVNNRRVNNIYIKGIPYKIKEED